ncbi:M1 family metallopeptidase [Streptomyces avidinii]|uniref:Aminopeptidase N n=1 Tax=Streptomyces avidinii TaxID=1895 RepID=A0ABS4L8P0_STRAV|nr:M1 family metallopeptidase [Streptomyces avidinii]MBP2038483.1 aminopeptidase N [Streptomyces avidinii]GGZ24413.1 zinc metalloprotease [Streptomyces avidinii]
MQLSSPRLRAALLAAASLTLVAAVLPPPTPLGIGDRLFPELGNPGYDVLSYDLSFAYKDNLSPLDAVTVIDARALQPLERINLDFTHGKVASAEVNGEPARFESVGEDLVLTPARPVAVRMPLRITIRHTSDPRGRGDGGWVPTEDGLAMANQADAAHRVFPCNDHPADKAIFTFRITAPAGLTAVANGEAVTPARRLGPTTTWTYRTRHPMATELAQVSVGRSEVVHGTGPHGLPLRDVVPAQDRKRLDPWLKKTAGHIEWMEDRVGRYPFENYGVLIARATTGFELETQTLSLFESNLFSGDGYPDWYVESVMVHELAHQWFGDSVSPRTWSDLWLNEGHATWYEALYADGLGKYSLERRMREAYQRSDQWRAAGGPPAAPKAAAPGEKIGLFRPVVYDGAALILYALRQEVGAQAFDRIERRWVAENRDGVAGTADFVRLASQEAGRDLGAFLEPWLYGATTPPMPGHPEWSGKAAAPSGKAAAAPGKAAAGPGHAASGKPAAGGSAQ